MLLIVIMKRGLQTEIANDCGVTSQYINQILNGKRPMRWFIAKHLAVKYPGTSPEFWMDATVKELNAKIKDRGA